MDSEDLLVIFRPTRGAVIALQVLAALWLVGGLLSLGGVAVSRSVVIGLVGLVGGAGFLWLGLFPDSVVVEGQTLDLHLNGVHRSYPLTAVSDIRAGAYRGHQYPVLVMADGRLIRLRRLRSAAGLEGDDRVGRTVRELRQRIAGARQGVPPAS